MYKIALFNKGGTIRAMFPFSFIPFYTRFTYYWYYEYIYTEWSCVLYVAMCDNVAHTCNMHERASNETPLSNLYINKFLFFPPSLLYCESLWVVCAVGGKHTSSKWTRSRIEPIFATLWLPTPRRLSECYKIRRRKRKGREISNINAFRLILLRTYTHDSHHSYCEQETNLFSIPSANSCFMHI